LFESEFEKKKNMKIREKIMENEIVYIKRKEYGKGCKMRLFKFFYS